MLRFPADSEHQQAASGAIGFTNERRPTRANKVLIFCSRGNQHARTRTGVGDETARQHLVDETSDLYVFFFMSSAFPVLLSFIPASC